MLEQRGIPTVVMGTYEFEQLAKLEAKNRGLADLPLALIPHPLGGIREDEVLKKAEGAVEIVRKALSYPARQIVINAGEDGSVIVGKILEKDQYAYGFDSQTGEYGDLVKKGIIDPTKVVRVAIQNAASVAALLITTEAMVAEVPKKNVGAGGMPPGGGGMGGMGGMDF